MSFQYEISVLLNLAYVFPEVKSITDGVNSHLATMGFDERLTLRGKPIKLTMTTKREMTDEELSKVKDIVTAQFCEQFAGSNPVVESIRRKSGNVEQSVTQ